MSQEANIIKSILGFLTKRYHGRNIRLWLVPQLDQGGVVLGTGVPRQKRSPRHLRPPVNEPASGAGQLLDRKHFHLAMARKFLQMGHAFFHNITYYCAKHNCAIMQFNNFREVLNSLLSCAFFDNPKGNKSFSHSRLLLPALPLSDLLKQDIADSRNKSCGHMERMSGYMCLSTLIFCLWASSYPGWEYFIRTVLNAPEVDKVLDMTRMLMPCFVFFVLGDLLRSGE